LLSGALIPEPCGFSKPSSRDPQEHSLEEYGLMHVKTLRGTSASNGAMPNRLLSVKVRKRARYVMDPSPIPKFDRPKLENGQYPVFGARP